LKKLLIAFISILSLSLFSCGNSEVTPGNYNIIGSWKYVSDGGTITIARTFNENGAYFYQAATITITGTYETDGTTVTITTDNGNTINTGRYTSTDTELILTMESENGPTVYKKN
tara:strand:+ start:10833 stop:11177 length:345 start_codon:yes stop_codon:yes gene_type:complete